MCKLTYFEMDQIFIIIFSFIIGLNNGMEHCYTYEVPEGIQIIQDGWNQNRSNLTLVDDFGNSFDIYKSEKYNLEDRIKTAQEFWGDNLSVIERIEADIVKLNIENQGPFEAFDSLYLVEKDTFMISVNGYFQGDPSTHEVFEEKALQLVRSIAHGGMRDEFGTKSGDCGNNSVWTWGSVWKSPR